ncbi:MAG: GTPase ObgE [Candidatus Krumholzibacteria bacterium]|nr:GTPase ObgE [Candidatus Krumholzibacteria bacterium]
MFIDRVELRVKSGNGGNGCVSFRREKFIPRGGPDGGDGGRGGDVIIKVQPQMRTLLDLRYKRVYAAKNGRPGEGVRKTGKSSPPVIVNVPPGTLIEDIDTGQTVADLTGDYDEITVVTGGRGGQGNWHFRTSRDQAPRRAMPGAPGDERNLRLTLKLIADVGLVGLPNAGKSTLLRSVSEANPVVAEYPFSTTSPNLGIVKIDEMASFCMVDIPGLIEGAHEGKGLGLEFLRHVERCRVLCFILDAASHEASADEAYRQLISELGQYSAALLERPRFVALNKVDLLPGGKGEVEFSPEGEERIHIISALARSGLDELMREFYTAVLEAQKSEEE